jgi:glycosyltransferase involved in cell wall biosynthesis
VCFSDAGASEVLTDRMQGRIIPAGDEQAFAAAVRDIVSDSQIRAEMSAGARELARRFRPSAHAAAVAQILEHMAA